MAIRLGQDNDMYQYSIHCSMRFPERVQIRSESTDSFFSFLFLFGSDDRKGELLYLGDF